ncbi:DUF58 domain-containing protein, partial [Frankia sp. CNm7]|uniref:DUF58 domain-containing protein n=1 Tax=Frankia nepalensis TaxID=1836974 RepID=UPI00193386AA
MTAAGTWSVTLAVILGAAGGGLRYPGLVALAAGFALALGAAGLAVAGRDGLVVSTGAIMPVTRGEPVTVTVTVENRRRRRRAAGMVELPGGPAPVTLPVRRLRRAKPETASQALTDTRRGVWCLGPAVAVRRDPLGLLERRRGLAQAVTLVVHPRRVDLDPLVWSRHQWTAGAGRALPRPGLAEFERLREYVAGDDLRRVHWLSSARAGTLQVRTHVDPARAAAFVLLDTRRGSYPAGDAGDAAFEDAVDVAASVTDAYVRRRLTARLRATGGLAWPAHVGGQA